MSDVEISCELVSCEEVPVTESCGRLDDVLQGLGGPLDREADCGRPSGGEVPDLMAAPGSEFAGLPVPKAGRLAVC